VGLNIWSLIPSSKGLLKEIKVAMLRRELKTQISNKLLYIFDIYGHRSGRYYDYGYIGCRGMKCGR